MCAGLPVRHLVFTNVTGTSRVGFRVHAAPPEWAGADAERLTGWLAEVARRRASLHVAGWTAAVFRAAGTLWSSVACVRSGWRHDALGREGGVLVHGVFTPVLEASEAGAAVHTISLIELLNTIDALPADGLEAYLDACDRARETSGPAPDPVALVSGMDPAQRARFLADAAGGTLAREAIPGTEVAEAMALAQAAAALPPRLRAALRWSVGLLPADQAESPALALPTAPPGGVQRYDAWLRQAVAAGRADELGCVLRDWDRARSWQSLIQWVDPA